jgi:hypothetical protein
MSHRRLWTHKTHHGPDSGEATTFPYVVYSAPLHGVTSKWLFVPRLLSGSPKIAIAGTLATLRAHNFLSCSRRRELSNGMSHVACTQGNRVDSWLLVVESQIANLTPDLSFGHNLCYRCRNGSCEAIFNIYASRPFQRYKKHLKARCFDPCNWVLNFWESRRTPKSPFQECECHPHTPSKWGCDSLGFMV